MFEIGWGELLLIAITAIVFVGPKELPGLLRTVGQVVRKVRGMASDFQGQFNDVMREANLQDVSQTLQDLKSLNPVNQLKETVMQPLESTKPAAAETESSPVAPAAPPPPRIVSPQVPHHD